MENIQDNALATEDNVVEEAAEETAQPVEAPEEEAPELEQTIGELEGEDEAPQKHVVDQDVFVSEKKARKAAEKELRELKRAIEEGASQEEVDSAVEDIAEDFDVDPAFMQRLVATATAKAEAALDKKYADKMSAKEKAEKFDAAFDKQMKQALDRGPEFQSVANQEVIKALAKLPENKNKTVSQLLEETYGNALTGKRTVETTQPGGGKDPEPLDLKRAENDIEYFNEVMKDPKKKAQYNKHMLSKGF